jgi:SGNH hydrolase-like domain, acetyltransferase AlgX
MEANVKATALKALLLALGIGAGAFFLITKLPRAFDWTLHPGAKGDVCIYGDLYRDAKIKAFKPRQPLSSPRLPPGGIDHPSAETVNHTSNFLFGDSFAIFECGGEALGKQLAAELHAPVLTLGYYEYPNPLTFLGAYRERHLPCVLVFEVVERQIDWRFHDRFPIKGVVCDSKNKHFRSVTPDEPWYRQVYNALFEDTAQKHEYLFKNSLLTFPLLEWWNTLCFDTAGLAPSLVPLYSSKPPLLFAKTEVDTFFEPHTDEMIDRLAGNIAQLARDLREEYNCELILSPVPDKLTVYCSRVTQYHYDGYLPRLSAALRARGVRTVELLPRFQSAKDLLYFPTDTHWNERGVRIAVEEVVKAWPGLTSSNR